MNWILNSNNLGRKLDDQKNQKIIFTQKRKFSGEVGEYIIILEKNNYKWVFTKYFEITDIEQDLIDDNYNKVTISLELKTSFKQHKLIEDYSYSLLRVNNFKAPQRHFNRIYSRIEDVEFDAIIKDKIYTNRTILGTILNALHPDHQKSFLQFLAIEEPTLLINKTDVDKALNYLYDYVRESIIEPIIYLKNSSELFNSVFENNALEKLGFTNDIEKSTEIKMLKPQIKLIEEYLEFLPLLNKSNRDTKINTIFENQKFIALFRNSRLPINLK
ncbi:hypothetical protein [Flavobacterium hercynium]|uniref:Uncharacterized protein n=1 Tax=Flavobacterium hercynium TaxID=387094 RepID=A0A226GTD2_9FLAO|nr:hypothetical protein [Flavobacterium hercynium]OXA84954.1 hypothetical protein B0A66_20045 [Flavobacterium hercynium]SMP35025.1 hypothetical protein SAMN06265346_11926 [Flavobacterium hercynium]